LFFCFHLKRTEGQTLLLHFWGATPNEMPEGSKFKRPPGAAPCLVAGGRQDTGRRTFWPAETVAAVERGFGHVASGVFTAMCIVCKSARRHLQEW
ncbi:hypothetical protein KR200_011345, partial [Drosophila serrata]